MFREIKPDKHRKKITFLYTEDGKVENVNGIANTLTDDLKSKVSVEKEFEDVKDFIQRKKINLKCDLIEDTNFIKKSRIEGN